MNEATRRLTLAAYAVAFYFMLSPIADIATNVWPFDFSNEQWRYGLAAITSNYVVSALFALLVTAFVAAANEHRWVLRLVALVSIVGAVILAVMSVGLLFDYLQIANLVRPEESAPFKIGAMKAGMKIGVVCVVLVMMAVTTFRASRTIPVRVKERRVDTAPLVR